MLLSVSNYSPVPEKCFFQSHVCDTGPWSILTLRRISGKSYSYTLASDILFLNIKIPEHSKIYLFLPYQGLDKERHTSSQSPNNNKSLEGCKWGIQQVLFNTLTLRLSIRLLLFWIEQPSFRLLVGRNLVLVHTHIPRIVFTGTDFGLGGGVGGYHPQPDLLFNWGFAHTSCVLPLGLFRRVYFLQNFTYLEIQISLW